MKKQKKGFSLLELTLVLGVGAALSFIKFQDMIHDQEDLKASAAGQQIAQIGDAVNGYINIRYDKLSTLVNATGTGTDPGPRTCSTGTSICTITAQTLVNEGLLPTSYVAQNSFGSDYSIQLKRTGTDPNYIINGIIFTNSAWIEGNKTRYDLLGKAMQKAGIDSGMSKTTSQVSGYNGSWTYTSTDFPSISKTGLLGYRVGYDSAMYSVYLRRDGTLPMTGNLNMGANDINNAKNITASGTGIFGGEVTAHNGYGDAISFGGDAAGSDYEIRLGAAKQLTIYSPNAASYSTVLSVNRNSVFEQRIATNGLDPNNLPSGWGGGVRTYDAYASGTVGVGDNSGNIKAYMNNGGNIYAGNDILSQHYIYTRDSTGTIIKAYLNADGNIYASGNLQVNGNAQVNGSIQANANIYAVNDVFSQHYIYTRDSTGTVVKAYLNTSGQIYASSNIQADGNITSSSQITSNGRLTTNEFMQINGVAAAGNGCSPNGLQGRASDGSLLSCVSGVWTKAGGSTWQACRTCGGRWPYTIANFTLHGDSGVNFNGYGPSCSGSYTNGVSNDGDYMQLCSSVLNN